MKASTYTITTNVLKATISHGVKTKYDWLIEIESLSGQKVIGYKYQCLHLTKKHCIREFNIFRSKGFAIVHN
jgi:hypothetical protein